MGILGFLGAGIGYPVQDIGVSNFEIISFLFPDWAVIPFLFMMISGLLSTVDCNLCAVSSLTTDIGKGNDLRKTKAAMLSALEGGDKNWIIKQYKRVRIYTSDYQPNSRERDEEIVKFVQSLSEEDLISLNAQVEMAEGYASIAYK